MCPKMFFWEGGGLRVKMWKYCVLTPERHYPAWICVYWCIACQNRFNGLSARSVERFLRTQKEIKKLSGNFGYMGRSNPWGHLDQMWRVGRYGGRNRVCNIWWLSVKRCECGERGKFAFSHWLDASPLQHWSHYRVRPSSAGAFLGSEDIRGNRPWKARASRRRGGWSPGRGLPPGGEGVWGGAPNFF